MTSAIILAAGSSTRMGETNKLTLPYSDSTILETVIKQLQASAIGEIVIVLGHEMASIKRILPKGKITIAPNHDHLTGMTSSIKAGIKATANKSSGYLICLSDMPLLTTNDYNSILSEVNKNKQIIVPLYQNTKGNPVYFSHHFKGEILSHVEKNGCKGIVKNNRVFVNTIHFDNNHILRDIDTPADFKKLEDLPNS